MRRRTMLVCLLAVLIAVLALSHALRTTAETQYIQEQLDARNRLEACMNAVKGYKEELGIEMSKFDIHATGMIGDEESGITTSLGAIEAKRTTADPDMAALLVRMLHEAGLSKGDTVGAGFSGSFPALNLAVICACDAMGLDICYISSVGASTFGANQEDLSFPDMAHRLYEDGYISCDSLLVTPGGDMDLGLGTIDPEAFGPVLDRIEGYGIKVLCEGDFQANLEARKSIYTERQIECFVAVGGNITSMGKGDSALSLGQGVIRHSISPDRIDKGSGLVEWYLAAGLPVINLLNIKKICADYGIPFDPSSLPEAGNSVIYHVVEYPVWLPVAGLLFAAFVLGAVARSRHKERKAKEANNMQ